MDKEDAQDMKITFLQNEQIVDDTNNYVQMRT